MRPVSPDRYAATGPARCCPPGALACAGDRPPPVLPPGSVPHLPAGTGVPYRPPVLVPPPVPLPADRDRRQPGEVEGAGADLRAEHGVADHEAPDRDEQREEPDIRDVREDVAPGTSDVSDSSPTTTAAAQGSASVHQRLAGIETRSVYRSAAVVALTSPAPLNMLSSESSSGRTSSSRASSDRASRGSATATSRARFDPTMRLCASTVTLLTTSSSSRRQREAAGAGVRMRTRRGRSAIASRIAR